MLIDSHAHLDFPTSSRIAGLRGTGVDYLESVLDRAKGAGVSKIVTIGTSVDCSKKCIEIAEKFSSSDLQIFATCGIHPEDGKADIEKYGSIERIIDELSKLTKTSDRVVGIGECGLDYYIDGDRKTTDEDKSFQRELFAAQVGLTSDLDLPLVVHCRNGWDEIFDLIQGSIVTGSDPTKGATLKNLTGVFHSWTGDWQAAQKAIDLGFYISFSGIVTFKNAPLIQEAAKKVLADRILVETDSPFLTPIPLRGQKNEPENVKIIASYLSEVRNTNLAAISEETSKNAQKLFKL